jgi:hypothetical protein
MAVGIKVETVNYVPDELLRDYFKPVRIIYNNPVTICYFADGTKRMSTCRGTDQYNKEFGVSVCVIKKIFRRYSNFLRLLNEGYEQEKPLLLRMGQNSVAEYSTLPGGGVVLKGNEDDWKKISKKIDKKSK